MTGSAYVGGWHGFGRACAGFEEIKEELLAAMTGRRTAKGQTSAGSIRSGAGECSAGQDSAGLRRGPVGSAGSGVRRPGGATYGRRSSQYWRSSR